MPVTTLLIDAITANFYFNTKSIVDFTCDIYLRCKNDTALKISGRGIL